MQTRSLFLHGQTNGAGPTDGKEHKKAVVFYSDLTFMFAGQYDPWLA